MATATHAHGAGLPGDGHDHHDEHPPEVVWSSKMPVGMMGTLFFIGSEAALFGSLFMAYFIVRVVSQVDYETWAHAFGEHIPVQVALLNTAILVTSSVTIEFAEHALKHAKRRAMAFWLGVTLILGLIFLGVQIMEYVDLVHEGYTAQSNAYTSVFFSLTGLHGSHVAVGAILLAIMLVRTLRGHYEASPEKKVGFKAMAVYWHFVDVIWIIVISTIYLPGNLDRIL